MLKTEDIRRVEKFDSTYELLDNLMPEFVEGLGKSRTRDLVHFDDYESFGFCVLSDFNRIEQTVLVYDTICGDVIGRFDSVEAFKDEVMNQIIADEDDDDEDED